MKSSAFLPVISSAFEGWPEARAGNDGRAVLVVVEHRDIAHLLQPALDLKAAGGGDVLQVDAAKGTGQQANGVDDVIHIFAADAQGEGIHIGKSLEQGAFASITGMPLPGRYRLGPAQRCRR